MITLRLHSRAPEVTLLQRLLNHAFQSDHTVPTLDDDGYFGALTDARLRHFQRHNGGIAGRMTVNGVADDATWRALGLIEDIAWPLPQVGQNTGMSCWVVSAGLATGRMTSAAPTTATYTTQMQSIITRRAFGGLDPELPNIEAYAADSGMRLVNHVPPRVQDLAPFLRRGPAILLGLLTPGGRHVTVISGYYKGPTDYCTVLRIHNPAPMGRGSVELVQYPMMVLQGSTFEPTALIVR